MLAQQLICFQGDYSAMVECKARLDELAAWPYMYVDVRANLTHPLDAEVEVVTQTINRNFPN